MDTAPPSLLAELEAAIQGGSSEKRAAMLRRVTDLFIVAAPRVTPAQAGVFDDVFEQLIDEIESRAVLELSERMSAVENAPDRLIRRLAHDDAIEISGPVLARSVRLGDEDLVAIARTKSQAHLAAIAGRAELGEAVTGVLVERGDMVVARRVASNGGARFSDVSLRSLVDRASGDGDLASAVARRRDLSPAMFRTMLARATDSVRQRLLDNTLPGTAKIINRILAEVSETVESATVAKRDYAVAREIVAAMRKQGNVGAANLLEFAKAGRLEETAVTLSLLTGVPVEIIDRFLDDPTDDPILLLCKSVDLDWQVALAVLGAKLGVKEVHESRAEDAARKYGKLSISSAQRVLRFWQAREKLAASLTVAPSQRRVLIPLFRQHGQRMKLDAFLVQFLGVLRRRLAVDRAMLGLAVVHLARFFRKLLADIVGVRREVIAQLFQLGAEFLLLRRDHRDRRRRCGRRGRGVLDRRHDRRALVLAGKARRHDGFLDLGRAAQRA